MHQPRGRTLRHLPNRLWPICLLHACLLPLCLLPPWPTASVPIAYVLHAYCPLCSFLHCLLHTCMQVHQPDCAVCKLQALQSVAAFRSLHKLVLADCSAVTTGGLQQLSVLTGLHHLALVRCPRVGDRGMTLLCCLTCLTYLALTGCNKVSLPPFLLVHPSNQLKYAILVDLPPQHSFIHPMSHLSTQAHIHPSMFGSAN